MFCASLYVLITYEMPETKYSEKAQEEIDKINAARRFLPPAHAFLVLINWVTSNSRI